MLGTMGKICTYEVWGKADEEHTVVRFVTSFATPLSSADGLLAAIKNLT